MSSLTALVLWNTCWSTILAMAVFGLGRLPALQRRPALLHLLWFGVLLRLIVPAVIAIPVLPDVPATVRVEADLSNVVPQQVSVQIVPTKVVSLPDRPVSQPPAITRAWLTVPLFLVAVSLAGTVILLICCFLRHVRIARLQRESQDASPWLSERVEQLALEMNLSVVPRVRIVDGLATPSVWGLGRRATILLPRHLLNEFDDDQWSSILAHELAHLARGDLWFNLIAAGVLQLFWWNPIAWSGWYEMRACQEASCDALALSRESQSRRRYAETLLRVVDAWNRTNLLRPQVLLGFGTRTVLTRRFEMIANSTVRPRAAMAATLCLALFTLTFFCLPVRGEKKEPGADKKTTEAQERVVQKLNPLVEQVNQRAAEDSRFLSAVRKAFESRDASGLSGLTWWDGIPEKSKQNTQALYAALVGEKNCVFDFKLVDPDRKFAAPEGAADGVIDRSNLLVTRQLKITCRDPAGKKILMMLSYAVGEEDGKLFLVGQAGEPKKPEAPALDQQELRNKSRDNTKTIMLAMHNYHDKHGSFPPPILYGKDNKGGKHPHSWRVALLPYLDQKKLYETYKFDEPWNSAANKEIQGKMPDVFRDPIADKKLTVTPYFVLVGKLQDDDGTPTNLQTLFSSKKGVRIQQVKDGTEHTLAVVEAKREIPWTKPEDIAYDPEAKLPEFGGLYDEGFHIGLADGAALFVTNAIDEANLRKFISPAKSD